jgi:two-component system sensor histidine kinase/response regulator
MTERLSAIAFWLLPVLVLAVLVLAVLLIRARVARQQLERERHSLLDELESYTHTAAHDLRTPLASIVGYSSLVREKHRSMSAQEIDARMDDISRLSFSASRMLDGLLLLSTVRSTKKVRAQPVDMGAIVSHALDRLKPAVDGSGAVIKLPEHWPAVNSYAAWIEEVWYQYTSNAIRYGGKPPRLELGADRLEGGIRFWVQDNGPGLDADQRARLFVPFGQLHQARTRGHGLGLTVIQRILEKLGGAAGVESEPGEGSRFYFILPDR